MRFLVRWMVTTVAVVLAATFSGVRIESWGGLLGVAFFVGLLNALARPLLPFTAGR